MTFPLSYFADFEALGGGPRLAGIAFAILIGAAFGFVLERAGFGRAQKLMGQFYGTDMTVLKVMFTGIVTTMVGAVALSAIGVLDLESIQASYPTFLWPMILGGLLLGAGFVTSGYCPGTSFVGAASGKLDALATIGGVLLGSLVYAEAEPALRGFLFSGSLGAFTLASWLHISAGTVAVLVALLAVGAFAAAGAIERKLAGASSRREPATAALPTP